MFNFLKHRLPKIAKTHPVAFVISIIAHVLLLIFLLWEQTPEKKQKIFFLKKNVAINPLQVSSDLVSTTNRNKQQKEQATNDSTKNVQERTIELKQYVISQSTLDKAKEIKRNKIVRENKRREELKLSEILLENERRKEQQYLKTLEIETKKAKKDKELAENRRKKAEKEASIAKNKRNKAEQKAKIADKQRQESEQKAKVADKQRQEEEEKTKSAEKQRKKSEKKARVAEQKAKVADKQRQEEEEKTKSAEKQRKKSEKKARVAKQKRQEIEILREIESKKFQEARNKRELAKQKQWQEDQRRMQAQENIIKELKASYIEQIASRVWKGWRYEGAKDDWTCSVHILQNKKGKVEKVALKFCNVGNKGRAKSFKDSIIRAVNKASPLPIAPDERVFDRKIIFNFRVN